LTDAIQFDPQYAVAYRNLGQAWRAKGNFDRAIAEFTEAIRLDPNNTAEKSTAGSFRRCRSIWKTDTPVSSQHTASPSIKNDVPAPPSPRSRLPESG
jgi:tetratricopeptide (TPR) repeat protein